MKLSNRILNMQFSPIRKLTPYAAEAKKRGTKVYHLNIGQPDVLTPDIFFKAISNFKENVLKYTESQGMDALQESFIEYYKKWGTEFTKDELLITNGGSEAIMLTFMTLCDPGDEILSPEPFYTNYNGFAQVASAKMVPYLTKAEDGFHLPPKEVIESKITDKTRALMISNPGNPTGTVYTAEELRMLGDIAKEHDLFLIADEVYREFVYDGLKYTSALTLKDIEDRVIIVDSISKRYSACGARIGLVASKNKNLIHNIMKLCQSRLCVPTVEQIGAAALKDTPESYFIETRKEYQKRRDILVDGLKKIPGVVCQKPTGAFYIVAKLPVPDAEDFAKYLLTEFNKDGKTVMVAPAGGFYATPGLGKDEVRISYCLNCDDLKDAMDLLKAAIEGYQKVIK
ncbi:MULTISPECIES: pyridoxal phosphate-dependent aminotransferase [Clostridium]|uniref:Aminotransferase n=2 Tax=Clostridium TaxID=1485 RepID=D8GJM8_CLOLD|nr:MULTISPECIES: pyridoxal phosphate-dependent aminotransferase [Clostridium]ADK15189.1 aspartate aminotransferase [Clostridium ljungdahlii DSM 13528]OAA88669.1 Aspartate aminotransferase [Clostridium ljungdahlii DSM 13528]RMD02446.1 pyridoxal phosphate-dependent aminotransferase [Clostridium autoethanogenum]